ncbi:helix-turn-helix domain-containing protein [Kineosporia babensis]|uniref:Uncharacterized protein n=1 Tax=Kineosporia babensis TaxID=499548 RepID=A0A9X1SYB4_9ACTN|nr:hypothetical protein [Kineosporia babensis]MCD5316931.1 hypothetical protein [Kineosporia babensis]
MHADVSTIVYEIRRLARDFPGESFPPEIVPTVLGFADVDTSKAAVLRLSPAQRRVLGLAGQGYRPSQIAQLTASSLGQTRSRLRSAAEDLGLSPRLAAAFGTGARPVIPRPRA